jgi:hypothetical protein
MKKLLTLGLLSIATLAWATASASAWWPCFPLKGCCGSKCCSTICIRQYNAFTPICCGSLSCDGCCPMTFGGCNFGGNNCGGCNFGNNCGGCNYGAPACCVGGGDACCLGQLPAPGTLAAPPPAAAPAAGGSNYQAPLPNAASYAPPMPWNPYAPYNPYTMSAVQRAGYQPYNAMPPVPYNGPAPYYWNNR